MRRIFVFSVVLSLFVFTGCHLADGVRTAFVGATEAAAGAGPPPGLDEEQQMAWHDWIAWLGAIAAGIAIPGAAAISIKNSKPGDLFGPLTKAG